MHDIFQQIKKKPLQFVILFLIFLIGGILFIYFNFDPVVQRKVIYMTGAGYFFWSLYHHYKRGDLHVSLVIEYLVLILFALVLITQTLF